VRGDDLVTVDRETTDQEMVCYVYGIVPADSPGISDDVTGLDDVAVDLVRHGEVAAVVGRITQDRPPGRRTDLVAHSRVLDAFAAVGAVIPVRFGSVLPDRTAVTHELLEPDEERFAGLLADLAGRFQFNLRARYNEAAVLAEVVSEQPEIAQLRERTRDLPEDMAYADRVRLGELVAAALEAKRERDTEILLDVVLPHTVAYHLRAGTGVDHMADVAFLVDADHRGAFEDAAEEAAEAMHERARLRLLGPLAPYDFVAEE
jgi:hypothetical protein